MRQLTDYFSLNGKVALVTGAASGIGFQVADALSAAGAYVAIVDASEREGLAAIEQLGGCHGKAKFWLADVSDVAAVKQVIAAVEAHFGRINILINSAGVDADPPSAQGFSIAQWQRAMQLNVNGSILCSKHVADAMERAGGGVIVNVLSLCGMTGSQQALADLLRRRLCAWPTSMRNATLRATSASIASILAWFVRLYWKQPCARKEI